MTERRSKLIGLLVVALYALGPVSRAFEAVPVRQ
jgi:hypothetical protein